MPSSGPGPAPPAERPDHPGSRLLHDGDTSLAHEPGGRTDRRTTRDTRRRDKLLLPVRIRGLFQRAEAEVAATSWKSERAAFVIHEEMGPLHKQKIIVCAQAVRRSSHKIFSFQCVEGKRPEHTKLAGELHIHKFQRGDAAAYCTDYLLIIRISHLD